MATRQSARTLDGPAAGAGRQRPVGRYARALGLLTLPALLVLAAGVLTLQPMGRLQQAPLELFQAICLARSPSAPLTPAQQMRARRRHWALQRSNETAAPAATDPSR